MESRTDHAGQAYLIRSRQNVMHSVKQTFRQIYDSRRVSVTRHHFLPIYFYSEGYMDEFTKVPVLYWKYDFTGYYTLPHVSKRWRIEQICFKYVPCFSFVFVELDGVALNNLPLLLHLYFDIIIFEKGTEYP